jgi:predicted ATPase/DNA-binding SARP family transcriptional activator
VALIPAEPPTLEIRLLGPFALAVNGRPVPRLRSRAGQWLLALLALRAGQAVERSWLAGTLWPDSDRDQALYNLRRNLTDLRRALGPETGRLRTPSHQSVLLDLEGAFCDVIELERAARRGEGEELRAAASLYRGPLLEGCDAEWILAERAALGETYLQVLERLAAASPPEEAAGYLRRVLAVDAAREPAHQRLLEALAAAGDHAGVTRAYRDFRLYLQEEMGTAPSAETAGLFERIRRAARKAGGGRTPASEVERSDLHPSSLILHPSRAGLPQALTRLIGREAAVQEVLECLSSARLVTLTGTGGIGKTRLAVELGGLSAADYPDGVWFVDLAPLGDPAEVPAAVARALEVRTEGLVGEEGLAEALIARLSPCRLLLILDNCEHLAAACACLAAALLGRCGHLHLLATSRQPLGIPGERMWRVPSLEVPPAETASEEWDQPVDPSRYASVRLFVERAHFAHSGFTAAGPRLRTVARICRRLDGIPLAIELAAARTRSLSLEQIAVRLEDQFALLTRGSPALPRHQTLRAAMDWSYDLLSEPERALLRRLSVFSGGFSLEAAEAVCGCVDVEPSTHPHTHTPTHPLTHTPPQRSGHSRHTGREVPGPVR